MGQKETKAVKDELKINYDDWQPIRQSFNVKILLNHKTHLQAQSQIVSCNGQNILQQQLDIYHHRKIQQNALVSIYFAQKMAQSQASLCGIGQNIKVIYQRIPRRLGDLKHVSFQQALLILSQSFRGYKFCYEKVGIFEVTENMIGFNCDGEVKVWLNQNFAENHPLSEKPVLQVTSTNKLRQSAFQEEKILLQNVIDVVQRKTEQGHFPKDFRQRISSAQTFVDAYCEIEKYCQQKNVWIPERLVFNNPTQNRNQNNDIAQLKKTVMSNDKAYSNAPQPHATYIPNPQYSYPRMTYLGLPSNTNNSYDNNKGDILIQHQQQSFVRNSGLGGNIAFLNFNRELFSGYQAPQLNYSVSPFTNGAQRYINTNISNPNNVYYQQQQPPLRSQSIYYQAVNNSSMG